MENNHHLFSLYEKLKKEIPNTLHLSLEQVQNVFQGNTVIICGHESGNQWMDFRFQYDQKTDTLNVKTINHSVEKKQTEKIENKTVKRKGVKF